MKRLSNFVLSALLSCSLTLTPVMAQTPSPATPDDAKVEAEQPAAQTASSQELGQKSSDTPSLNALPPADTSNPPGRTSKAVVIAVIVAGAAAITAIILAFHGGHETGTVLAPGTATVGPPGH
jgi:hypothetical protein